jgi:hypothetical protein
MRSSAPARTASSSRSAVPSRRPSSSSDGATGQEVDRVAEVDVEVLHAPRNLQCPGRVTEVSAQLAHDRRDRVARERHADRGIESLDRLQEPELADLDEIVERLAAMREPARAVDGNPTVLFDQLVAQRAVAGVAPPAEALLDRLVRRRRPFLVVVDRLRHRRWDSTAACATGR